MDPLNKYNTASNIYADPETWKIMEIISSVTAKYWSESYLKIIQETCADDDLHLLELGCGTSYLSKIILDKVKNKNIRYHGLDLDPYALTIAHERLNPIKKVHLEQINALSLKPLNQGEESPNIILCFSNTFLCLGNFDELTQYLQNIKVHSVGPLPTLILSVVPWDNTRRAYNQAFCNWTKIKGDHEECFVKIQINEYNGIIEQNISLKKTEHQTEASYIQHQFLALCPTEIESLFNQAGWNVTSWRNPIDASNVNPLTSPLPEFIITCSSKN